MSANSARRSASIPRDTYLARRPGIVMEQLAEGMVAREWREPLELRLNQTASLLWLLCGGKERVFEIRDQLRALYPDAGGQLESEVSEGLSELRARRLLRVAATEFSVRPLLRVGFCNFWPRFDPRDNYFTWMLTRRFDVILVDPRTDTPDVVFFSIHASAEFDHGRVERSRTRKILFARGGARPNFSECDFAFTTRPVENAPVGQHLQLPLWSLFVDWDRYQRSEAGITDEAFAARCHPLEVCNRLYELLSPGGRAQADSPSSSRAGERAITPSHASATPPRLPGTGKKLTIGMATFDDYDGVYFTVQAIRLFHPEVTADTEIVVIDNHPDGPCAQALQSLGDWVEGYRYVANRETQGTATRDLVFREAQTPYVMCVDSHVLLAPGTIRRLIDYFDSHPDCDDLLQGPLVYDDLQSIATHFDPVWSGGMWGVWAKDPRGVASDHEEFEIPMQGLGLFACRQRAWLGFNPRFFGFGGEEGYIHTKFRQAGRRNLCLPFLRWTHRFRRPFGTQYRNTWEDRIRNYFIGAGELGLDTGAMEAHFRERMGADDFERLESAIRAEMSNPFFYFDAIYCITLDAASDRWQLMQERFTQLGIGHRVRRFSAVEDPGLPGTGRVLSHCRIIERARKQGLAHVLVFEDDVMFLEDCLVHLKRSVDELRTRPWSVFHLDGESRDSAVPGCRYLRRPCSPFTSTRAVAYHGRVYQRLLDDLPSASDGVPQWVATPLAIDHRYLCRPAVCFTRSQRQAGALVES